MSYESVGNTTAYFDEWVLDDVFSRNSVVTAEKKRLLIVEDDYLLGEMLSTELENFGYVTETIISAEEIELVVEDNAPDICLTDYRLPVMNGFELIQKLQQKELFKDTIFLIMSGSREAKKQAEKANVGFVEKPFNFDQILSEIERQTKDSEASTLLNNTIATVQKTGFGKKVKEYLFGD